jgi:hypothetical protein
MGVPLAASLHCAGDDRRVPNGEPESESRAGLHQRGDLGDHALLVLTEQRKPV